jgi:hypothetical protein
LSFRLRFLIDLYHGGGFFLGRLGDNGLAAARTLDLFSDKGVRNAQQLLTVLAADGDRHDRLSG